MICEFCYRHCDISEGGYGYCQARTVRSGQLEDRNYGELAAAAIDPVEALRIKRRIDKSNQDRTDMVEYVDSYLLDKYKEIRPAADARLNTETPAWAIDRLSILALKIYHMARETERTDVDETHREACRRKLDVLLTQQVDLSRAIEELIEDIEAGRKYMKTYKQMKMYNDPSLNPVLYGQKK